MEFSKKFPFNDEIQFWVNFSLRIIAAVEVDCSVKFCLSIFFYSKKFISILFKCGRLRGGLRYAKEIYGRMHYVVEFLFNLIFKIPSCLKHLRLKFKSSIYFFVKNRSSYKNLITSNKKPSHKKNSIPIK